MFWPDRWPGMCDPQQTPPGVSRRAAVPGPRLGLRAGLRIAKKKKVQPSNHHRRRKPSMKWGRNAPKPRWRVLEPAFWNLSRCAPSPWLDRSWGGGFFKEGTCPAQPNSRLDPLGAQRNFDNLVGICERKFLAGKHRIEILSVFV